MLHKSFDGLTFMDATGILRVLYPIALKQRRELDHCLTSLNDRLSRSALRSVHDLYDHDPEFQALADHCLALQRIDPAWIDIDMLTEFLLPHRDAEQAAQAPILRQLNFPKPKVEKEGDRGKLPPAHFRPKQSATYEEAIAALWTHTGDLEQALRVSGYENDYPGTEELSKIMEARSRFLDPKSADEPRAEEMEAIAQEIEQRMKAGTWFGGFSGGGIASPEQTDELLNQMVG
jgi:hypothetical protein